MGLVEDGDGECLHLDFLQDAPSNSITCLLGPHAFQTCFLLELTRELSQWEPYQLGKSQIIQVVSEIRTCNLGYLQRHQAAHIYNPEGQGVKANKSGPVVDMLRWFPAVDDKAVPVSRKLRKDDEYHLLLAVLMI